jgi:streptogramin lyase
MLSLLLSTLIAPAAQATAPRVHNTVVATYQGAVVELHGRSFGSPGPASRVLARSGSANFSIASTGPLVQSWEDQRIVLQLPADAPSGALVVQTAAGTSEIVQVHVYAYDSFDIPVTAGTNASPLSLEVDAQHRVWINQEFHRAFHMLDPAVGVVQQYTIPVFDSPGPFATTLFGDRQTTTSVLGEDVLIDPKGRIWFTQGGGSLYDGQYDNHSRVVCVLPDAPGGPEFRAYNIPGVKNEVIGLAWDPIREWIWFANGGRVSGAALVGFDPELLPWDNDFDFQTSLDHLAGYPGAPQDPVYHFYDLPTAQGHPAHIKVAVDGKLWFTYFWGRAIGRLDPITGAVNEYPVPKTINSSFTAKIVGPGPWEIVLAPNGDVIFCEFFDGTITRFDATRADDPATWQLDANGKNPGMKDWVMPKHDRENDLMHSIAWAPDGKLWYTNHVPKDSPRAGSLGFLTEDGEHLTRLPPLDHFPGVGLALADGVAIDPVSEDIWFCEFFRKRIGRLREVPELP